MLGLFERFRHGVCDARRPEEGADPIRLATAAILLDIGYADGEFSPVEKHDLVDYLQRAFAVTGEMAADLLKSAEDIRNRTIDHFALTFMIRKNATLAERIEIVKTMWRMVYSDGKLTDYEHYLVRKLADLLGIEHHVMIDAKVEVLREIGQPTV